MKHTPGPWDVTDDFNNEANPSGNLCSITSQNYFVAEICPDVNHLDEAQETARANARLMAASPELLEALTDLVARCDGAEGVRADGSNIQTIKAHAILDSLEAA